MTEPMDDDALYELLFNTPGPTYTADENALYAEPYDRADHDSTDPPPSSPS